VVLGHLASDPRLSAIPTPRHEIARRLRHVVPRIRIVPLYVAQAVVSPRSTRKRLQRTGRYLRTLAAVPPGATSLDRIDAFERLILQNTADILLGSLPVVLVVFPLPALLSRLLSGLATRDELQSVLRSLPYNPTTEMDLTLWRLAVRMRSDSNVLALFRDTPPEQLAARYREGNLPPVLQQGLADFLRVYGHRAVAEIDLGVTRWGEDPTHVLGALANYLRLENPRLAPSVQFSRGGREARAMVAELTRRARERNPLLGRVVAFALRRIRTLTGLREVPKFNLILMMWSGRQLLLPVGEDLVRRGCLQVAEDIFFLDTAEARQALQGKDFRDLVAERRAAYRQESQRRHIPRVLLSDGTEPERAVLAAAPSAPDKTLVGTPASAGVVTGTARTILDPTGAHLLPGEILVAPSTDPGWTPLFLTAGGLVMEMGGAMSHGAVVAREYGIPAVVGVVGATERIATGQQIIVDGSAGSVSLE
jgi:rifampicin phosphotransferase